MSAATMTECACLPGAVCASCSARGYESGLAGYAARIYPRMPTLAEIAVETPAQVCRACKVDAWDGMSSYPQNPDYGDCAQCGTRADLIRGCCGECYDAGYREACARPHSRTARPASMARL